MRKIYIILLSLCVLLSCSREEFVDEAPKPEPVNENPTIPNLIFPANNQVCTNFKLGFDWEASSDANGDAIAYQIDIATNDTFENILFSITTSETTRAFNLEKGNTYYWRVKAIDSKQSESEYSVIQAFFTEPDAGVNHVPFSPSVISPKPGEEVSGNIITLDWDATDTDDDPLLFDVYFGTTNPPVLLAQDISVSALDVNGSPNTTYYWRVVVKDDKQGVAIGRVWSFRRNNM
ncbi:hypothetical protein [Aquimarina sp. AU119]|uniref:hypothetical protein n=1 Tax=Aquimarina sp. AU119 TaxID=2108528 RepID=UPI000D697BCC|nr:hypothetical protein [Aquimarina sp. AU119]